MASAIDKKLSKHLECAVCLEIFTDPKVLSCQHTYCRECLERLVTIDFQRNDIAEIKCPECRKETEIPDGDVKNLQGNFLINKLLSDLDIHSDGHHFCEKHDDEKLKLFCQTCNLLICRDCILIDHCNHIYKFVKDIYPVEKKKIEKAIEESRAKIVDLEATIEHLDDLERKAQVNLRDVSSEIDAFIEKQFVFLEKKRGSLKNKLNNLAGIQKERRQNLIESLNTTLRSVKKDVELAERAMKSGHEADILATKKKIIATLTKKLTRVTEPKRRKDLLKSYYLEINTPLNEEVFKNIAKIKKRLEACRTDGDDDSDNDDDDDDDDDEEEEEEEEEDHVPAVAEDVITGDYHDGCHADTSVPAEDGGHGVDQDDCRAVAVDPSEDFIDESGDQDDCPAVAVGPSEDFIDQSGDQDARHGAAAVADGPASAEDVINSWVHDGCHSTSGRPAEDVITGDDNDEDHGATPGPSVDVNNSDDHEDYRAAPAAVVYWGTDHDDYDPGDVYDGDDHDDYDPADFFYGDDHDECDPADGYDGDDHDDYDPADVCDVYNGDGQDDYDPVGVCGDFDDYDPADVDPVGVCGDFDDYDPADVDPVGVCGDFDDYGPADVDPVGVCDVFDDYDPADVDPVGVCGDFDDYDPADVFDGFDAGYDYDDYDPGVCDVYDGDDYGVADFDCDYYDGW